MKRNLHTSKETHDRTLSPFSCPSKKVGNEKRPICMKETYIYENRPKYVKRNPCQHAKPILLPFETDEIGKRPMIEKGKV